MIPDNSFHSCIRIIMSGTSEKLSVAYGHVVLLSNILSIPVAPYPFNHVPLCMHSNGDRRPSPSVLVVLNKKYFRELCITNYMVCTRGWPVFVTREFEVTSNAPFWSYVEFDIHGTVVPGNKAYQTLFNSKEDQPLLTDAEVTIEKLPVDTLTPSSGGGDLPGPVATSWSIKHHRSGQEWTVFAKLVVSEEHMYTVATLLYDSHIPSGKSIQLQADAHIAGKYTWVGTVASYDDRSIPYAAVSADIGCGISVLPVVRPGEFQAMESGAVQDMEALKSAFMLCARRSLFRGKKSDAGDQSNVVSLFGQALEFFGAQITEESFVSELLYVFTALNIVPEGTTGADALQFASKYMQSLGSSGNHFIELTESSADGALYAVTHSGSRGLGALVYNIIASLSRIHTGSNVATGALAVLYRRTFDVLCRFAQINRILCGMAVLKALNFEYTGAPLRGAMLASSMFRGSTMDEVQRTKLLFGLTHNGIKTFVDHGAKQIVRILSKGAVALSRRSDVGIVALRAGEGCVLFVLNTPSANWVEVGNQAMFPDYAPVYELSATDLCFTGHGAGRSGSATATRRKSSFRDMIAYYKKVGFIGNLSPNVIGDNPEIAYKASAEILANLPLDEAVFHTVLKTLVNHKEGISYQGAKEFAAFCVKNYATLDPSTQFWLDLGLVQREPGVAPLFAEQTAAIDTFLQCYECRPKA